MRKLLSLIGIGLVQLNSLVAQTIPNPGFENWTTTNIELPTGWGDCNFESHERIGVSVVTKVTGVSGYAVRMETKTTPTDTQFAYIFNGVNNPSDAIGGVPYSQMPTSITGSFRYSLGATDTAFLWLIWKKNGTIIDNQIIPIKGTGNQLTFTTFSFPLTLSSTPDSLVFAAASSNAISNIGITNGSYLELDNLGFAGPGITQVFQGGTFDNWTINCINTLNDWNVQGDIGFSRISPGHSGQYAVQMETIDYGSEGIHASGISLGEQSQFGPIGGIPYNQIIDTICGYYKYFTNVSDSGMMLVWTKGGGLNMSGSSFYFVPNPNWTYFEHEVNSFGIPDTINVYISSSYNYPQTTANIGSRLILDDITLKSQVVGLATHSPFEKMLIAYPNPVTDLLQISWNKSISEPIEVSIYTLQGQLIYSDSHLSNGTSIVVNVKAFPAGKYLVKMYSSEGTMHSTFIKN